MVLTRLFSTIALTTLFMLVAACDAPASGQNGQKSEAQDPDFDQRVLAVIRANPEIVIEAIRAVQAKEDELEREHTLLVLAGVRDDLERRPGSPVLGNPDGDVTLVEFMDYRCGYCKRVFPALRQLVAEDPDLRVVIKEFPILGQDSYYAAKAALAAVKQGKYAEFHAALMELRGNPTKDTLPAIAKAAGLDPDRLSKDMDDPAIDEELGRNMALAQALGISGTPAFIVGDEIRPGAVPIETLRDLIAKARKNTADKG